MKDTAEQALPNAFFGKIRYELLREVEKARTIRRGLAWQRTDELKSLLSLQPTEERLPWAGDPVARLQQPGLRP